MQKKQLKQNALLREIVIILIVKVIILFTIWFYFFSDDKPDTTEHTITDVFLSDGPQGD